MIGAHSPVANAVANAVRRSLFTRATLGDTPNYPALRSTTCRRRRHSLRAIGIEKSKRRNPRPRNRTKYSYVSNGPLTFTDPTGWAKCPTKDCGDDGSTSDGGAAGDSGVTSAGGSGTPPEGGVASGTVQNLQNAGMNSPVTGQAQEGNGGTIVVTAQGNFGPSLSLPNFNFSPVVSLPGTGGGGTGAQPTNNASTQRNLAHIGTCFFKGAAVGAVAAVGVGALAVGAVVLGAPVAAVTAVVGIAGMIAGAGALYNASNQVSAGNWAGAAYSVGSILGGVAVGGAGGGRALAEGINGVPSPPWSIGSDLAQTGYQPSLGPVSGWLGTGLNPGAAAASGTGVGSAIAQLLGGC
jgi:hypothetical protein